MTAWFLLALGLLQAGRAPVPDAGVLKEKEKLVREVFKTDYAKKAPGDRIALAKKLLQQAVETKDDPGAQYIMLREAADLAAQSGDAATAVQAVGTLAGSFEVDGPRLKLGVLSTLAQEAKTPESAKAAAEQYLKLVDEAAASDDFDIAEKAAAAAVPAARKAKDVALTVRADAKIREAADLKARGARVKAARETLLANPDDPAANLELGQFECFTRGNWDVGLPLLAKGSNEDLKALAQKDLARPDGVQEQVDLGDAWKDRSDKESAGKQKLRERAVHWYEQAYPRTSGLLKLKLEKAIAALAGGGVPGVAGKGKDAAPGGIVAWWKLDEGSGTVAEDSSGHKLQGKIAGTTEWVQGRVGKGLRLGGADGQVVVADAPSLRLTGDLTIALWFRKDDHQVDWARLVGKGDHRLRNYGLFSGGKNQQGILLFQQWGPGEKELIALQGKTKIEAGNWYHVGAVVRGDEVTLFVGGQIDASARRTGTPVTSPDPLTLGFAGFHQPFPGVIDDVRIYDRALTEADMKALASVK
jgi:hypothetical protein